MEFIQNIDNNILIFIQNNIRCAFLDVVMPIITSFGDAGITWIIAAIIMLCNSKYRNYGIILVITLICGYTLCEYIIKPIVGRIRPCNVNPLIQMLISKPTTYSFPSGHSFNSFSSSVIIYKTNKFLGKVAFILAALIAFSRMYLYVHYPSDVLCGIIMGICFAFIIYRLFEMRLIKK